MKQLIKSRKELILIIVGLIATIFSYVYYFILENPKNSILIIICAIDLIIFFLNAYVFALCFNKSKIMTIIISVAIMIGFVLFFELFVILASVGSDKIIFTWDLFCKVFLVALFASPSLILLLPVLWFVCEVLSYFKCYLGECIGI